LLRSLFTCRAVALSRLVGIDKGITNSYTFGMKTAISVPDDIFKEVNKIAKESGRSRSEVFVDAVKEYIKRAESRRMLETINKVCDEVEETPEDILWRKKALQHFAKYVLREED